MYKTCSLIIGTFLTLTASGQETQPLMISGRVMDSQARPVTEAEVAVYENVYDYFSRQENPKLLAPITKTDSEGNFVFHVDIYRQYDVFIVAKKKGLALGWDGLNYGITEKAGGYFALVLEPPTTVAGTVADANGNPIAGAWVRAIPKTSYLSRLRQRPIFAPEEWFITHTDAEGKFRFDDFAADVNCDFWVEAPGWHSIYKFTTHYLNSCGYDVGRTDIKLELPAEIDVQGRVIDSESGQPVAGISLLVEPDNIRTNSHLYIPNRTVSGPDGQFSFKGIPWGRHILRVLSPSDMTAEWVGKQIPLDMQAGQPVSDIAVKVSNGAIVEATVLDAATREPLQNARVTAWGQDVSKTAWTREAGKVQMRLPVGEYNMYAEQKDCSGYRSDEKVSITENTTTPVEILLDREPCVSGLVIDESGEPVSEAIVRIYPEGDETLTNSLGEFQVGYEAREGEKRLIARHIQRNLAAVVRIETESKEARITLQPALSITGQVTDPNGIGIPATRFGLSVLIANCLSDLGTEVLADAQGSYGMDSLPPPEGIFEYRFSVNAAGYGPKTYQSVSIAGEPGTPIRMETIVLQPADQSISGVVLDSKGKSAARIPIFLHGKGQPDRDTATDVNGLFVIRRICKGPLRLQASFDSEPDGAGFLNAEGGDRNVKIILGQTSTHTRFVSLVGQALPDITALNLNLDSNQILDQKILLCFCDMTQRPSRHYVEELVKKAEELKGKGVVVALVQAEPTEQKDLDEWIAKYQIPFAVGVLKDQSGKTKFAWGVKALPWLILTDKQHVVQAEGFAIDKLAEEVGKIPD